ncbi:MAG: bifunctional UDP-N-acetylglucosamine diphosphorylase/glucosamine-1-phosphate N-acetyltransferase GlmU [Solirubrobacterales bacterium]
MSDAPTVLVMAAGQGTRMRSSLPKVMHPVAGRPMVAWPLLAAREAGAGRLAVIVSPDRDLSGVLPEGTETIVQPQADGTGGALRAARELIASSGTVLVLSGDHPLVSPDTIAELLETHRDSGAIVATVTTVELDDPGSYGRIVRNKHGEVKEIVEVKAPGDATDEELAIREVNAGTYAFEGPELAEVLDQISNDNAQGEYYLGDVLPLLRQKGTIAAYRSTDPGVNMGVNDRADLAQVTGEARRRIIEQHMLNGVTVVDPDSTWIEAEVEIAPDATIEPGCFLRGRTEVGAGTVVGPSTTLIDSALGELVTVPHSYLVECEVADGASVGPFAYIRPGTRLGAESKAGSFVEIKNSEIGPGTKVPHLSYIGDAEVGPGTNLGAGTITANYDGFRKHRTVIGRGVRTGVDTALIAPVNIGDGAYTGAGSVITGDVPDGALGIARAEQSNVEGFAERKQTEDEKSEEGKGS